jgi:hypothetical protein
MWLDLILILLAISPLMLTTKFHLHEAVNRYSREDEAKFNAWPEILRAVPAVGPRPARES